MPNLIFLTAFDEGDTTLKIESLESSFIENALRIFPGTEATEINKDSPDIGVYPNPYRLNAAWDGSSSTTKKIIFYPLPSLCTITIFTLNGDVITTIKHEASNYSGNDIDWFENFGGEPDTRIFSGGEHAWDILSESNQTITQGIYLFSVKDLLTGEIKQGRFVVLD